jgi:hypothetical protein
VSKPKPVNWEFIKNTQPEGDGLYQLSESLIRQFHSGNKGIDGVGILFMWRFNIKPDQDSYVYLADVTKSSDKVREIMPHDFIIGINKAIWPLLDHQKKKVIIDSQLERIARCFNKDDSPKEDDKSRPIYRLRRLEVMDDKTLNRRHAMNLGDVQLFASDYYQKLLEKEPDTMAMTNIPSLATEE